MRRKLFQIDNICNNQKINQIFRHELNINKRIKKVTNLDIDDYEDLLSIINNTNHYRFKYIFVPPRGDNVVVNSANLMKFGFLYSKSEEYEEYFQNPNYVLLVYTPIFQDYYLKLERVIYAKIYKNYTPIINFYITNLNEEFPIITGSISSEYKEFNFTLMKQFYLDKCYEKDLRRESWNLSDRKLKMLLKDKTVQTNFFYEHFYPANNKNIYFKCKYWWTDENKKHFIILNNVKENIDKKLMDKLGEKFKNKIDKLLTVLSSIILVKKLA